MFTEISVQVNISIERAFAARYTEFYLIAMVARIHLQGITVRPATTPGSVVALQLTLPRLPRLPWHQFALATATFLQPITLLAFAAALWRIGVDVRVARPFAISSGLFSHWQVWLAVTGILQACVMELNRLARGGGRTYFSSASRRGPIEIEIPSHAMQSDCDSVEHLS